MKYFLIVITDQLSFGTSTHRYMQGPSFTFFGFREKFAFVPYQNTFHVLDTIWIIVIIMYSMETKASAQSVISIDANKKST